MATRLSVKVYPAPPPPFPPPRRRRTDEHLDDAPAEHHARPRTRSLEPPALPDHTQLAALLSRTGAPLPLPAVPEHDHPLRTAPHVHLEPHKCARALRGPETVPLRALVLDSHGARLDPVGEELERARARRALVVDARAAQGEGSEVRCRGVEGGEEGRREDEGGRREGEVRERGEERREGAERALRAREAAVRQLVSLERRRRGKRAQRRTCR